MKKRLAFALVTLASVTAWAQAPSYPDTFKQLFRRFYASIADASLTPDYPVLADGLRQMKILDAELASHKSRAWVSVPA